jgi:hypothetical protein
MLYICFPCVMRVRVAHAHACTIPLTRHLCWQLWLLLANNLNLTCVKRDKGFVSRTLSFNPPFDLSCLDTAYGSQSKTIPLIRLVLSDCGLPDDCILAFGCASAPGTTCKSLGRNASQYP